MEFRKLILYSGVHEWDRVSKETKISCSQLLRIYFYFNSTSLCAFSSLFSQYNQQVDIKRREEIRLHLNHKEHGLSFLLKAKKGTGSVAEFTSTYFFSVWQGLYLKWYSAFITAYTLIIVHSIYKFSNFIVHFKLGLHVGSYGMLL